MVKVLAALGVIMLGVWAAFARPQSGLPDGVWLAVDGERIVEIAACAPGSEVRCGTLVWLRTPTDGEGRPLRDDRNVDLALQRRAICELQVLSAFKAGAEAGRWTGTIYVPDDGQTFQGTVMVEGDRLSVTHEINSPDATRSRIEVWTRVTKPFARCSPM